MKEKRGYLRDRDHTIYWEQHGNIKAPAVIVLHGGPGAGLSRRVLKYFNLKKWRVVLFDQRGCGKSTPNVTIDSKKALENNTTWDLIEDIEAIRKHLHIKKWMVFGGSWGTTLAIAYGQTYPKQITSFVLRGVTLITPMENEWLYSDMGVSLLYPEEYIKFLEPIKKELNSSDYNDGVSVLEAYYDTFRSRNNKKRMKAIKAWNRWEHVLSFLVCCPKNKDSTKVQESMALIENHYFINNAWFELDEVLENMKEISNIPCTIIQGRYDLVCPIFTAMMLKENWKKAKLITTHAGHASSDPENAKAIKKAIKSFQ